MEIDGYDAIKSVDATLLEDKSAVQPDETFKLILIGSAGVGKSSILLRATTNKFSDEHNATIGVEFGSLLVKIDGKLIRLQTWDTGGMESFRSLTRIFYKGAHGVLVVYEISNPKSFSAIEEWLEEARQFAGINIKVFLIANKVDLQNK
jgi:Ras-related protein Rab-2A